MKLRDGRTREDYNYNKISWSKQKIVMLMKKAMKERILGVTIKHCRTERVSIEIVIAFLVFINL